MRIAAKRKREEALIRTVERLERRLAEFDAYSRSYSWSRLALILGGGVLAWIVFELAGNTAGSLVLLAVAVAFGVIARYHTRLEKSIRRHRIWRRIKAGHVARLNLDWSGLPAPAPHPVDPEHPFERDLNLTGPRSLHQLLDTAVSREGSARLRAWLLAPVPDPEAVHRRQALVRELTPLTTFRDRLTLNSALVSEDPERRWEGDRLLRWLDHHTDDPRVRRLLTGLSALAAVNIVLFGLFLLDVLPAYWVFTFVLYVWIYMLRNRAFSHLFDQAEYLLDTLGLFRSVLLYLEWYPYDRYPHLARLCRPFRDAERRPSRLLKHLTWLAVAASSQKSELLWLVLNAVVPWDLYFSYRLSRFKEEIRTVLPGWLDAWYDLEALCALANFAYLNPGYAFPDVTADTGRRPIFEADQIGHPLIPDDVLVRNDFIIGRPGEITLVTGSNMSGKSTFLRTLGMNLCLAYAGGPVDARRMATIPFRLFTCINVSDSVNDGISYFYAEVRRLKALLAEIDRPHPFPLFYLIDEIFRGTNNRERLIGSRSYVRSLAERQGTGLISTHDLELVQLADELPALRNMHFREEVIDGKMVFEYRLRPGPCPTTNALKIMRMEGLPVERPVSSETAAS